MLSPLEIDRIARRRFTYVADLEGKDEWRSHADAVLAGEAWSDDCDGLASTVLDLAGREGHHLSDRFRMFVATAGRKVADHMVGAIRYRGQIWVVGDTFAPAYRIGVMPHHPVFFQQLDEVKAGTCWRGAPR